MQTHADRQYAAAILQTVEAAPPANLDEILVMAGKTREQFNADYDTAADRMNRAAMVDELRAIRLLLTWITERFTEVLIGQKPPADAPPEPPETTN